MLFIARRSINEHNKTFWSLTVYADDALDISSVESLMSYVQTFFSSPVSSVIPLPVAEYTDLIVRLAFAAATSTHTLDDTLSKK